MHVGLWNSMNSNGAFTGAKRFGAQIVPVVGDDAAAEHVILERLASTPPAQEEPPEQETKQPLRDPILAGLLSLDIKNEERRAQRDRLVASRLEMNKEAEELVETELRENHEALAKQHRECRERGRQQQIVVDALRGKLALAQQEINRCDAAFANRRTELESAQAERGNLPRFATDAEISKADGAIQKAAQRVEKAATAHAEACQEYNRIVLTEYPPEKIKLDEIVVELNRLEALLAGASAESAERLEFGFIT